MTRERKLAIQMWKEIRSILKNEPEQLETPYSVYAYKNEFCTRHNLHWFSSCWFCHYIMRINIETNFCSSKNRTCPLYKPLHEYYPTKSPEQKGCLDYFIVSNQCSEASSKYIDKQFTGCQFKIEERIAACDRIIKALGGEV